MTIGKAGEEGKKDLGDMDVNTDSNVDVEAGDLTTDISSVRNIF